MKRNAKTSKNLHESISIRNERREEGKITQKPRYVCGVLLLEPIRRGNYPWERATVAPGESNKTNGEKLLEACLHSVHIAANQRRIPGGKTFRRDECSAH